MSRQLASVTAAGSVGLTLAKRPSWKRLTRHALLLTNRSPPGVSKIDVTEEPSPSGSA